MADKTGYQFPIPYSDGSFVTYTGYLANNASSNSGFLLTWGYDGYGTLGNGTTINYSSPIFVGTLSNWSSIRCGSDNFAAIKTDGTLWTWGKNRNGQLALGDGSTSVSFNTFSTSSPVQVGGGSSWSTANVNTQQIIFGGQSADFSKYIKNDGTLWTWGRNHKGQLGNETVVYYSSPIQIGALTNWKQIGLGRSSWFGIKTDGTLWASGDNTFGLLGNGTTTNYSSPIQIGALTNWKQVTASGYYTASAVKTDGTLWTWGINNNGQLGNGNTSNYSSPIQVGALTNWKQVACGYYHIAAIKTDGTLWTCGYNNNGQLGNGTTTNYSSPIQVGSLTTWSKVSCGRFQTAAIKTDGTLWTCGYNANGQLGNGTTINYSSPIQVGALTNWSQIAFGSGHTIAVKTDGTLWTWGYSSFGELGNGTVNIGYSSPIQVGALTNWNQVFGGSFTTYATNNSGNIYSFGSNLYGELGAQAPGLDNYSSPVQVGSGTNWSKISTTGSHMAAVKTDGTLWTCGYNYDGQLGNGTTISYSSPIQVGSLTTWNNVFCAPLRRTFAIKTDGSLWGCGYAAYGALGNGVTSTSVKYSSPIQIGALTNWSLISATSQGTAGITSDGKMWSWGVNSNGSIGQGAGFTVLSDPTQIGTATNWSKVSLGPNFLAAIKTDGTLWACGYNNYGQVGNGTTTTINTPIQIGALTNWSQIACGQGHAVALKTDGTLWTWGYNVYGGLGNGSSINYSSPIQVGSLANWNQVTCGYNSSAGIGNYYFFSGILNPIVDLADVMVPKDQFLNAGLWALGGQNAGIFGNGNTVSYSSPIQIGSLSNWKDIDAEQNVILAIQVDGTLWAWGYNDKNQLGTGGLAGFSSPVQIGSLNNWKKVTCGSVHSGSLKTNGTIWTWGWNLRGELGYGNKGDYYNSPVQVGTLTTWKQLDCGGSITAAVKNDGTLWSWGRNDHGQLGNGTTTDYSSPIQVGSLTDWKQASCGSGHIIAVKIDGTLWSCGYNDHGQLGNGTNGGAGYTANRYSSPIQIGSLTNWRQVFARSSYSFAIKTDGTLWGWGVNGSGELANSSGVDYSSPIQIGSLTNWKQVSPGYCVAAIKTDGTLWTWGNNSYGQLGNGTSNNTYYSPIQIGIASNWRKVTVGTAYTGSYNCWGIQSPDLP